LFQFENLKNELDIKSIDDLQDDKFLGNFDIDIIVNNKTNYDDIDNKEKLEIVLKFLDNVFRELKNKIIPKKGSDFISGTFEQFFAEPKTKIINEKNLDDSVARDNKWYVLDGFVGTSEEKALINFIKETFENLKEKYKEIYLLRNEEVYKIYDFERGRAFMPDFILFLKTKNKERVGVVETEIYYQVFIEPKGNQYIGEDGDFKS